MFDKLIFLLPALTMLVFIITIAYRGNTVQSCLLFILSMLPLMDLKVTQEAWGGFKTFDAVCFYSLVFLFKDFTTISLPKKNNFYLILFFLLIIIMLIGGLASEFPEKTYLNIIKAIPIFIFGRFFITESLKDPQFNSRAIKALKLSYLTCLAFLIVQVIVGLKFTFYPALATNTIDPVFKVIRYPGVFFDSQAHGQFLAMGCFLFLYIEEDASKQSRLISYFVFVLAFVAILLAGSRSSLGGLMVGMVVIFFLAAKQYRIYGTILVIIAIAVMTVITPKHGVFDRAENLSEDYLFRQSLWIEAFDISKKHPYLGIGSGNYKNYVMRHAQNQYLEIADGTLVYFDQPENGYLKIMVELGFIGFAIYALFVLVPLVKGFVFQIKDIYDKRITFFMASLVSFLVAFNTVFSIYDNRILIMVASMAILIIVYPHKDYNNELAD